MILEALKKAQRRAHLTADEAYATFREIMNGEVTNTMKVRRPIVARSYAAQIEAMYAY